MKQIISSALIGALVVLSTGCTGTFKLTKKYNAWHRGMDSKWADEGIFLGSVILPVYFVTTIGDALIFNSMEFWGEENPITSTTITAGDESLTLTRNADGSILVEGAEDSALLIQTETGVAALDADGNVQYTAEMGPDGKGLVYDADGHLVQS